MWLFFGEAVLYYASENQRAASYLLFPLQAPCLRWEWVTGSIVSNVILQLLLYTEEKNGVTSSWTGSLKVQGSFHSTGLAVTSKFPRSSNLCTLTIASADPKSIAANKQVELEVLQDGLPPFSLLSYSYSPLKEHKYNIHSSFTPLSSTAPSSAGSPRMVF
ncbi:hypothetical protein SAY87_007893 [Trapa incisa]|uniref:Uncharacterized protein n=1 Tax=Trapa incisa TaxID=236973 RepID=A0AAN7KL75_9MYRT|nr:hypothetical protein SAY87_007893 [Trapa incisa]